MNNKTIYERLQQIEDEIQRLNNTLFALKTTDIKVYGNMPKNSCSHKICPVSMTILLEIQKQI